MLSLYVSLVLITQFVFLTAFLRKIKNKNLAHAIIALFFTSNIFLIYLTTSFDFLILEMWQQICWLGGIYLICIFVLKSEKWVLQIGVATMLAFLIFGLLYGQTLLIDKLILEPQHNKTTDNTTASHKGTPANKINVNITVQQKLAENIIYQDFIKKPNIYLISFDAMMPEKIANELLKVETHTNRRQYL